MISRVIEPIHDQPSEQETAEGIDRSPKPAQPLATNARMVWRGVRIDQDKCRRTVQACADHLKILQPKLNDLGVSNVRSHDQLHGFFERAKLLHLFQRNGKTSFDKGLFADFVDRHSANQGDVYSAMAQHFHGPELSEEDRNLSGKEFKKKHSRLRNRMKTCTLGIIYGLTPFGLSARLKTSKHEATALQERFMTMFPTLKKGLTETPYYGALRGYVSTSSGLRRYRMNDVGLLSSWERNWMVNHPVQGSAAVVFKAAGNRLHRLYQRYDAWLIIPMHDAFVFEAPLESLAEVSELTARVMCDAVQEHFLSLKPQVDVNFEKPECWNKDGHADAVDCWIKEPTYTF